MTQSLVTFYLCCLSLCSFATPTFAEPAQSTGALPAKESQSERLESALATFDRAVAVGDPDSPEAQALYSESLGEFESVIADGVENGHLFYNAGNAALRTHQIGLAIAYYRKAQRLIPGDGDIERNLQYAREQRAVRIAPAASRTTLQWLLFWYHGTSTRTRWLVGIGAYALFWVLLAFRLGGRWRKASPGWIVATILVLAMASGGSVAFDEYNRGVKSEGVVVRDETVLRKGNGAAYERQIEQALSDGVEFDITESRDSSRGDRWYRILLPDGTDGWLAADRVVVF